MCLFVNYPLTVKTTEENLTVYKVLEKNPYGDYRTPYAHMNINLNEIYSSNNDMLLNFQKAINHHVLAYVKGYGYPISIGVFHSCKNIEDACKLKSKLQYNNTSNSINYVIALCAIPQGTYYVEGYFDTLYEGIASESVIYEKIIEPSHNMMYQPLNDNMRRIF